MPDFQFRRRLGSGQYGEVWEALDRAVDQVRAVKLVEPGKIHDPSNFYNEPKALVAMQHDNIVRVFDAGQTDTGQLYIAMEYLPNGSLEDRYAGGVVPVADALGHVRDACRGAEHAHTNGFIHRDIKPANVLLGDDATGKLSDFGLATHVDAAGGGSPYGYIAHIAPEVLTAGATNVVTDVYALGITSYRLVNGDALLPTPAGLGTNLQQAIIDGRFPNRSLYREHVPLRVRRVINQAIHLDPAKRTQSAAVLRHALENVWPTASFTEVASAAVGEWTGASQSHTYVARIVQAAPRTFKFTASRCPVRGSRHWRLAGDGEVFATEAVARRHARQVLNRIAYQGS